MAVILLTCLKSLFLAKQLFIRPIMKRILLPIALFAVSVCALAQTFEYDGIRYSILSAQDETVAIEKYRGKG